MNKPINDGGAAFPGSGPSYPQPVGMTLRDYFAAKAMSALISCAPNHGDLPHVGGAVDAYRYADAMLIARGTS